MIFTVINRLYLNDFFFFFSTLFLFVHFDFTPKYIHFYFMHWCVWKTRSKVYPDSYIAIFQFLAFHPNIEFCKSHTIPCRHNFVSLETELHRRVPSMFKDVPLRTRRTLWQYKVNGDSSVLVLNRTSLNIDSALLFFNGTSLNSDSALLALNWQFPLVFANQ